MDLQTPTPEPRKKTRNIPLPELSPPNKASLANQVCWMMGGVFILVGLMGFIVPGLVGFHLSPAHNLIHLVSGGLALWFGLKTADYKAKKFSYWIGGVYLLLGLAGFAFGQNVPSTLPTAPTDIPVESSFLWRLIPGQLEFGTSDHILHLIIGVIFLAAAYFTLRGEKSNVAWH